MTAPGVARLDALGAAEREELLLGVCGARAWARRVAAAGPFGDREVLLRAAEEAWDALGEEGWREAFAAHPPIGSARTAAGAAAGAASRAEQARAMEAGDATLAALAEAQAAYANRFGHVFLIRAAGRSGEEILAACRARLGNDPATELANAAREERAIGRRRLNRLVDEGGLP